MNEQGQSSELILWVYFICIRSRGTCQSNFAPDHSNTILLGKNVLAILCLKKPIKNYHYSLMLYIMSNNITIIKYLIV